MNERNVHADTHPSGHPNKTAVNAENPIFGRPADPIPAVSFQQAAVVQSEKHPRETVQSPLLSEVDALPDPVSEEPVVENTEELPEQSAEEVAAVQRAELTQDSSEDLDAVAAEMAAKEATSQIESDGPETPNAAADSQFATGQKVRFTRESGNDTEPVYTIEGGELGSGDNALWFWRLAETPGLFLGQSLSPAGLEEV